MRLLFKISTTAEDGNRSLDPKEGTALRVLQGVLSDFPPEAFYACAMEGKRTALIVLNLEDASQIPAVSEPFYTAMNADIEIYPVMSMDDMSKGLSAVKQY